MAECNCTMCNTSVLGYLFDKAINDANMTEEQRTAARIAERIELERTVNEFYGVTPEKTGFDLPPNGTVKGCELFPCTTCHFYYGEAHECMRYEELEYANLSD